MDDEASTGPMTRGRTQRSGRTLGTVGLQNLGNTCYMNSALQCVRSVEELTKYFLSDTELEEINYDNPLGNNGNVAIQYGRLLKDMYRNNTNTSVTPRTFKTTIGKYAPSFSGYGQQDSQEFVGFLLDGLQEDLSRIKKKPYIEKPDSTDEMVGNPEAIREMADKVWDITKRRDDSVIADLFTGMYKSTLVCPVCDKVSITFDPFNNLTLQLPIENKWSHTLLFLPLNRRPVRIQVELDRQSPIRAIKEFVAKRCHVSVDCLVIFEVWKSKIFKVYDDMRSASEEISSGDDVVVYELECPPTNFPPPRVTKAIDAQQDEVLRHNETPDDHLLISVSHRRPIHRQYSNNNQIDYEFALVPHFIVLTPAEAYDEDIIRRKVLEQMIALTTWPDLQNGQSYASQTDGSEKTGVPLNETTAMEESLENSKITVASVDGEDDVVAISLPDATATENGIVAEDSTTSRRRPVWLDPQQPLPAGLDQLFELSALYCPTVVPHGYGTLENNKHFTSLSARSRALRAATHNHRSIGTPDDDSSSLDNIATPPELEQTLTPNSHTTKRMVGDDSDSTDEFSLANKPPVTVPIRAKKVRRTYSNKKLRAPTFHQQPMSSDESEEDSGQEQPMSVNGVEEEPTTKSRVLLSGEILVVDWHAEAFEALFNGSIDDNLRGHATYMDAPILEDPELDQRREAREKRRKRGITLDECLDEFEKEEILSEQDTWYCPRCKEHQRASKKFELWRTPDILVMHLKRFSSSGLRRDKLDVEVDFPIEGLDLSSRVIATEEGKDEIYDLIAVDDHWGGLGGGHYTAFAKSFIDGEWYEYNDSSATKQKDTSNIVSRGAYLLFYRRRSTKPLGGPRLQKIVEDYDQRKSNADKSGSDSGEAQRLGEGSSLHGSSSAFRGAGLGLKNSFVSPSQIEGPPAYSEHLENGSAAPPDVADIVMNDGLGFEDEAVDVTHSPAIDNGGLGSANWNWSGIDGLNTQPSYADSGTANGSAHSDVVQNASSPSASSLRERQIDFDNAVTDDEYEPGTEIPDLDEDTDMTSYSLNPKLIEHATNRFARPQYITSDSHHVVREIGEPSEPSIDENIAAEIHIDDDEV